MSLQDDIARYADGDAYRESLMNRFWAKVDRTADSCWIWTGGKTKHGYGHIKSMTSRNPLYAHRLAYEVFYGVIPENMMVDHTCHHRACVNPEHLRLATHKQNQENRPIVTGKSGVRGVFWEGSSSKWVAKVKHNGMSIYGGSFRDLAEAECAAVELRNRLYTHNVEEVRS